MRLKLFIPIIIMFFLTSCTQVIMNTADEIRQNNWSAKPENGSVITLRFNDDNAEFRINSKDPDVCAEIKGLCFIDDKRIYIYNQIENEPYIFEYKLKNNQLILKFIGGKLVLIRNN